MPPLQLHVSFPCYSTHPAGDPVPLLMTHRFDDLCLMKRKPDHANLFCFGCDVANSTVDDAYATSHLWSRWQLAQQTRNVKAAGIRTGATLLDSDDNPIIGVNPVLYAYSVKQLLLDVYGVDDIGGDYEWHCLGYGPQLLRIFDTVRQLSPATRFYSVCFQGRPDLPSLALLFARFSGLVVDTMAYGYSPKQYRQLIQLYMSIGIPASQIFLGVSVNSTPHTNVAPLVQLAKELQLGGMYVWNCAQDVDTVTWDPSRFPFIELVQQEMSLDS